MPLNEVKSDLKQLENKEKARLLSGFFKTGKGQYGEGDTFLGISVPDQRKIAKKYWGKATLKEIQSLLSSKIHEHRLTGLLMLVEKYKKTNEKDKEDIFSFYLKNAANINNWDLVDLSAPNIIGTHLLEKDRSVLYRFAKSNHLWSKRIAILSTLAFIRENDFQDALKIAEILITDEHDLIHKAVGWMLREIGKRNQETEETFLRKHHKAMPRTMLRYAIERFPESKKKFYMKK